MNAVLLSICVPQVAMPQTMQTITAIVTRKVSVAEARGQLLNVVTKLQPQDLSVLDAQDDDTVMGFLRSRLEGAFLLQICDAGPLALNAGTGS
jgi:hypothetical protein